MNRYPIITVLLIILWCVPTVLLQAQNRRKDYMEYIRKYDDLAVEQMKRHKIPASITLAQGLLESGAGKSELARKSNNHFGIKCGSSWRGRKVRHDDDAPQECFRAYRHVEDSYEDHSEFLIVNKRYAQLFKLKITDYKGWARGLKKAGYATNPSYATLLIQIIEDYELYQYDSDRKERRKRKKEENKTVHQIYLSGGLPYVIVKPGDTFLSIAKEFGLKARKLVSYNDVSKDYPLMPGEAIYLKRKNKRYERDKIYHTIKDGDTKHSISQIYGIRLKDLYKLNEKESEYIPAVGDRIWLK